MTLGEFRKITEKYIDSCTMCWASDMVQVGHPNLVERVVIDIGQTTDEEPNPVPNIVVL